jgi:intraflagellar transport protein 80
MLQDFANKKQWEEAIRLCRHMKQANLWACLAAMSVFGQDLNTAEVAYAAIEEVPTLIQVHKVQYITQLRDLPSSVAKAAELALLRRQPTEAEGILLNANLVYRAIKMHIDMFNWDRYSL